MKIYFVLPLLVMFYGCVKDNNPHSIYSYTVKAEDETGFDMTKISSFTEMIPLETTSESLIGKIRKVFLTDSAIIIWDSQTKSILSFDKTGKYSHRIGNRGSGPKDYLDISDVLLKENKIMISDPASRQIIEYDLFGNFISSWRLEYYIYSFYPDEDGFWGINAQQNEKQYYLIYFNRKDNKIDNGYFQGNGRIYLPYYITNYFSPNEKTNDVLFHFPYQDMIYKITDKTLEPFLHIDFGNRKNTRDIYSKDFQSSEYDGKIHNVYAYGDHLFFSFVCFPNGEMKIFHVYINLNDSVPTIYWINIKQPSEIVVQPLPEIIGLSRGKLIYQIIPDREGIVKRLNSTFENITFDLESNPILVLYTLN
ncbi:MAG: 6-bladed beta-propeller [Tannerella sp.]|jgi:hypothetical protein|nr:6-bladed beta-propeller [Tannerella sp.]